jgi:hypothetical protein
MKAKKIQIAYYDSADKLLTTFLTDDDCTPEQCKLWEEWLSDGNVDHPGAPAKWASFELWAA